MSGFLDDTIGGWTTSELQNFLQNIAQLSPTQLPPSSSLAAATIADATLDNVKINSIIDLSKDARMSRDGQHLTKGQSLITDFSGNIVPGYAVNQAESMQLALSGQARCQTCEPAYLQNADATNLTDGVVDLYLVWMPLYEPSVTQIGYHQVTQGVMNSDNTNALGIYSLDAPNFTANLIARTANDGTLWKHAAGYNLVDLQTPIAMNPGWYYLATCSNWSAPTTVPQILSSAAPAINNSFINGLTRTYRINDTTLSSSYDLSSAGSTVGRISWLHVK